MKKVLLLLIFAIMFSTAFADEIDFEDLQNRLDNLYTSMGYERNPVFEISGFSVVLDGYHKIEEQTDNSLSLVGLSGSDTIILNTIEPEDVGLSEDIIAKYDTDIITTAVISHIWDVYSENNCCVDANVEGIMQLNFVTVTEYAGIGTMFVVHGAKILAVSIVITTDLAEYMGYELEQYIPAEMNEIFSGISLIA